ncbi:MAG: MBL fold metallo-hydrolase [Candidatus Hodarchaeota archaeon]
MKIVDDIHAIEGKGFDSNMYLIVNEKKEFALVDTGHDGNRRYLIKYIESAGLKPENMTHIVLTHVHIDHSGGLASLVKKHSPKVCVYEGGADYIEKGDLTNTLAGMFIGFFDATPVDIRLSEQEPFTFGQYSFRIINTPGHTTNSICLYEEKHKILISGDTVFADGSIGRMDFPSGSVQEMIKSTEMLTTLDVEILLPGHMRWVTSDANTHLKRSAQYAKAVSSFSMF